VARRSKIRSLQKMVELQEYSEAGEDVEKLRKLMKLWSGRLPRKTQSGDVESWDSILVSRLTLLRRVGCDKTLEDEADKTLRATYLSLSALARRRGNYTVADSMHTCCKTSAHESKHSKHDIATALECRSNALKIALAKARDPTSDAELVNSAMVDAHKVLDEDDTPMLDANCAPQTCAALKKMLTLSGDVYSFDARLGGADNDSIGKAYEKYEAALKVSQQHKDEAVDVSTMRRKNAKIYLSFASFCDGQIRTLPGEGGKGGVGKRGGGDGRDAEHYAIKYVETLLAAIEMGSTRAQENFPRTLDLLIKMQSSNSTNILLCMWKEGCLRLPASALIRWLPQLISLFKSCPKNFLDDVEQVLMRVCKDYPQAMYMAVRVLKHEVPRLWKKITETRTGVSIDHKKLEHLCCALRHLQHPEDQLADLRTLHAIPETHEETYQELCADFGKEADRSQDLGDYRKEINKKLKADMRSKLQGRMPDDAANFFKKIGDEWSAGNKPPSDDTMALTRLSPMLHNFEGNVLDAGALVVPGQHLTLSPVRCEDDAPRLSSCDPEILVMKSTARPKRLKMRGSDGKEYVWLVKGGEDLRQDERLQQLFSSINHTLSADVKCSQRRLNLITYAVIPVSKRTGLVEWVQDTEPMDTLYSLGSTRAHKEYVSLHGSSGMWQDYVKCFKDGENDQIDKRFQQIVDQIDSNLMKKALMSKQPSAQAQFLLRANFSTSLAAMNASHYILGIGDRYMFVCNVDVHVTCI